MKMLSVCAAGAFAVGLTASVVSYADEAGAGRQNAVPVYWAYDFVNSVGVNTHILHADSFYGAQFELMKERLLSAHVSHIRDGAMDERGGFYAGDQADRFKELGKAGIRVTFNTRLSASKDFIQGFPSRVSPAFEAYEMPNELNSQHIAWAAALQSWMPQFKQYLKSNPDTASYPVLGPSLIDLGNNPYLEVGNQESNLDFGNLHKYYRSFNPGTLGYGGPGQPPCDAVRFGSLSYALCHAKTISGTKPIICTEAGYGTDAVAGRTVTPDVQSKYIARMLMLHLKAGVPRTFIYQLADYGEDGFGAFGLLTRDGVQKPSFLELRSLMNELYDKAGTRPPGRLAISISGETQDLQSILFAKSDGSYRLVLWLEKPSYDPKGNRPLSVPAQTAGVSVPAPYRVRRMLVLEDSGASTAKPVASATAPFNVEIRDNLTIVDIGADRYPNPPSDVNIDSHY
jgi:hypothetical protein